MSDIYQPQEDSFLLREEIKNYAHGLVLDIGTGSGIQALEASRYANKVYALDINSVAIKNLKKTIRKKKIKNIVALKSDLFSSLKQIKFDLIIFNPPYLPSDKKYPDRALDGGKRGYELVEKFFEDACNFLKPTGLILLVFSSLTNKNRVDEAIVKHLFDFKLIGTKKLFFEELFLYKISKSPLLQELEELELKDIVYFSRGKRGVIYTGTLKNKKIAIKVKRKEAVVDKISNEAYWLKILNKKNIGPKIIYGKENFLVYDFVEGPFIIDFIEKSGKIAIKAVLKDVLEQCFIMDKLNINKFEMHHPIKHIIVTESKKPVLIDFERAKKTTEPKNVTQFCQFLISKHIAQTLILKKILINENQIIELCRNYKNNPARQNFDKILELIK